MNKAPVSATFAQGQGKNKGKGKGKEPAIASSATSSASDAPSRGGHGFSPSALSPRHRAELARLSPGRSAAGGKREGSDGTPSMGSSFSDLDGMSFEVSGFLVMLSVLLRCFLDQLHCYYFNLHASCLFEPSPLLVLSLLISSLLRSSSGYG